MRWCLLGLVALVGRVPLTDGRSQVMLGLALLTAGVRCLSGALDSRRSGQ